MSMTISDLLQTELGVSFVKPTTRSGPSSDLCRTLRFETERGDIFVKTSNEVEAEQMLNGEYKGLEAIRETETVRSPEPLKVFKLPDRNGFALVVEYLDFSSLNNFQGKLGEQMACLHLHNRNQQKAVEKSQSFIGHGLADKLVIDKFGFSVPTSCGLILQENKWTHSWVKREAKYCQEWRDRIAQKCSNGSRGEFGSKGRRNEEFLAQKFQFQVDLILKKAGDRQVQDLWAQLQLKLDAFFKELDVFPSLLHGDLWTGNAGEAKDGPVIFDPATFYGHDEYDLGIAKMFGGFSSDFFNSYHNVIPKKKGFKERNTLYKLFHYLNHWNHFGSGYRSQSINLFKELLRYNL